MSELSVKVDAKQTGAPRALLLGALALDGVPLGLPAVTGRGTRAARCCITLGAEGSRTLNALDT